MKEDDVEYVEELSGQGADGGAVLMGLRTGSYGPALSFLLPSAPPQQIASQYRQERKWQEITGKK